MPCRSACPADTDIPGYLEAIYNNEFDKAYQINFNDNFFPEILGRVCSRPCEDNCRHGDHDNGKPVSICFSKRAAGKFTSSKKVKLKDKQKNTNKNILIIGGGVAGLASAAELKDLVITSLYMRGTSHLEGCLIRAFQYSVCQGN